MLSIFTFHCGQKVNDSVIQLMQECPILLSATTFLLKYVFPGDVTLALGATLF